MTPLFPLEVPLETENMCLEYGLLIVNEGISRNGERSFPMLNHNLIICSLLLRSRLWKDRGSSVILPP